MSDAPKRPARRRLRKRHVLVLIALLLCTLVVTPFTFRKGSLLLLKWRLASTGATIDGDITSGSFWSPLLFENVTFEPGPPFRGTVTIRSATATLGLPAILLRRDADWFRELTLKGVRADLRVEQPPEGAPQPFAKSAGPLPLPNKLRAADLDLRFHSESGSVAVTGAEITANALEPGYIVIRQLALGREGRRFSNLTGRTALRGGALTISEMAVDENVVVKGFTLDLKALTEGELRAGFQLAAFGGAIRGQLQSHAKRAFQRMEASGAFTRISIPDLARFFRSENVRNADGTIDEGKFSFNGSLDEPEKATFWTRLVATDFRFGERQWESLIIGATMVDRRITLHELQLRQTQNELDLSGELTVPRGDRQWWQETFALSVHAKVNNLTELAALAGPDYADASGQLTVEGQVEGREERFSGALAVAGTELSFRGVPVEKLHASLKLEGNEIRLENVELSRAEDFVRGRGVVNILGRKQYWGELQVSLRELAFYLPLLHPWPIPRMMAGGLELNWSGDGVTGAHSGAFTAKISNIRPLGSDSAFPIDAEMETTYSPDKVFFSRLSLKNDDSSFNARVTLGRETAQLQDLTLKSGGKTVLTGDATLPVALLEIWDWPVNSVSETAPLELNLRADGLLLHEAVRLSGHQWDVAGVISGGLQGSGTLRSFISNGELHVRDAHLGADPALAPWQELTTALRIAEGTAQVEKLAGRLGGKSFTGQGSMEVKDLLEPKLALKIASADVDIGGLIPGVAARTDLELAVNGPLSSPVVQGVATVKELKLDVLPDPHAFLAGAARRIPSLQPVTLREPYRSWGVNMAVRTEQPLFLGETKAAASADLAVLGTLAALELSGRIVFTRLSSRLAGSTLLVDEAVVTLSRNKPPLLAATTSGQAAGYGFSAHAVGSLEEPEIAIVAALPQEVMMQFITEGFAVAHGEDQPAVSLRRWLLPEADEQNSRALSWLTAEATLDEPATEWSQTPFQ